MNFKYKYFLLILLVSDMQAGIWQRIFPTREQFIAMFPTREQWPLLLPAREQVQSLLPDEEQIRQMGRVLAEGIAQGTVDEVAARSEEPLKKLRDGFSAWMKTGTPQAAAFVKDCIKDVNGIADKVEKNSNKFIDTLFNRANKLVFTIAGVTVASFIGYALFKRWCDREKRYTLPRGETAHWHDVVKPGLIKEALLQKMQFIKNVRLMHAKSNSCLYRTLLLEGERGTGKSAIAQLLAKESGIPAVHVSSAHFMQYSSEKCFSELYKLCATAMAQKECFMIIDTLDDFLAFHDDNFVHKLTQLLVEVIGAHKHSCMVVGITRNSAALPITIKQCFDDQIMFSLPDYETRKELLLHYRKQYNEKYRHMLKQPLSIYFSDDAVDVLAKSTEGLSGSKLESLVSELVIQVACGQ